jgi:phosphonate transport system substrate-binding protein
MRPTTRRRALALLSTALLAPALLAGCSRTEAAPSIRFTAIPDDDTTELRQRFEPLAEHLSETLGVRFEYVPTSSYSASVEAFKNGDVQLAWFGGLTGVQARVAVPGASAIAQGVVDPNFRSYFVASADSDLQRSDEFPNLEGRSFTFGSESSTSGRLMPEHFIRTNTGKSPEELFGVPNHYSGSHDKSAKLVESGAFETGVLNYKTYDRMVEKGGLDPERCRIVWITPGYADYNWTAHPSLDAEQGEGFTARLQAALVGLESPELLAAVDRKEGLIPATNEDFAPIEELARSLGFVR